MVFTKGDSNRCRNAYEKILHDQLSSEVLNPHKKNKHISVGRCRHIAIVHGVKLPPYELLSDAGFELEGVSMPLNDSPSARAGCQPHLARAHTISLTHHGHACMHADALSMCALDDVAG